MIEEREERQPGELIGPYRLEERLGRGGFSEVWRAVDGEGQSVALKLPTHPLFLRHLKQEKVVLAEITHPHLVRELAFDPDHDPPYLAMEYVKGENLRQAIAAEQGGFSVHQTVTVSDQVLDALQAIHDAGFIHRDLKPENILVTEDGTAKVIDLGLGRMVSALMAEVHVSLSMVSASPLEGTLAYMSPEQKWGGEVTPASDLYSFAVILFEMLTGELPRGMTTVSQLVEDISTRFDIVLRKALHEDPAQRYGSASELRDMIAIVRRERDPVPLPCAPPELAAEEVSLLDHTYLQAVSPYHEGDKIGQYTLCELLGRGGFGEIWKVLLDGEPRALKVPLGPRSRGKLRYEAELSGRLDHPRIPHPVDVQLDTDPPHLVYNYVEGKSLRAVLNERKRLPYLEALTLLAELAELIAYCHSNKIVHRDLKPENILLSSDGLPYLLDFGLGLAQGDTERMAKIELSLATARGKVGTFDYMAPEQRAGRRTGPKADVYALGVLAFELLSGTLPVGVTSIRDRAPDVPVGLEQIVRGMLSNDPDRRGSAAEVAEDLRSFSIKPQKVPRLNFNQGLDWGQLCKWALGGLFLLCLWSSWIKHPPSRYGQAKFLECTAEGDLWLVRYRYPEGRGEQLRHNPIKIGEKRDIVFHWFGPANDHRLLLTRTQREEHRNKVFEFRLFWGTVLSCLALGWFAFHYRRI